MNLNEQLNERFKEYESNVTPKLLALLAEATGVSENDLKALGVGFCIDEQAVIFANHAPNGETADLIRWFNDDKKRSLVADEKLIYIKTEDVPRYIKAKLAGNFLQHSHASLIAEQWIKDCWTGTDGKLTLKYYEDSYWEWKGDAYYRLKPDVLNSKLWGYLDGKICIEQKWLQDDWFITCRVYVPTKYKLRQIRWALKHEVSDQNNAKEHTTIDAGKGEL